MTRQEMLDVINMKMARTHQGDEGTGYLLSVSFDDVMTYVCIGRGYAEVSKIKELLSDKWRLKRFFLLQKQSDECIQYVYNLL